MKANYARGRWSLINLLILGLAWAGTLNPDLLHAQTQLADPEAYRQAKSVATRTFLDKDKPKDERLAAADKLGYPTEKTFTAMLAIGADRTEDDDIRYEAIWRHPYDERYVETILGILADPRNGGEELNARLVRDLSRRTVFLPEARIRQMIQRGFRNALNDPRDSVRLEAYRALVSSNDPVAVKKLRDNLRSPELYPVPLADAIDLLHLAGAVHHISILRPFLDHEDPEVRAQAAKALAVDPESRPRIIRYVMDRRSPAVVRLMGIRALAREDAQFPSYAIKLFDNPNEDLAIRRAAMHDFVGRMNYNPVRAADQIRFAQAVERFSKEAGLLTIRGGAKARQEAEELLSYLKKRFPTIKEHFENQ